MDEARPADPSTRGAGGDGYPAADLGPLEPVPEADAPGALQGPPPNGALWFALALLYRHRGLIGGLTALVAVGAVVISLLLPVRFAASARVLPPESSGGLGALIGNLSPVAASVLGGSNDEYARYLAILHTRSLDERVVEHFDLVEDYGLTDEAHPVHAAIEELNERTSFEVDMQFEFLKITVLDESPEQAAAMANFIVDELNRRNESLATEQAGAFRRYVEGRYEETLANLDSARLALQGFQERNGVVELPTMAQAYIESMATQRAALAQAEIRYRSLLAEYGPENPEVQAAQSAVEAARQAQSELLAGQDASLPVSMRRLPRLASEYARLYQDVLIQSQILEAAQPLYEQARFDEERDRTAVQVIDPATPPVRKAEPRRSLIVIAATLSGFLLAVLFVFLRDALRRYRAAFLRATAAPEGA